MPIDYKRYPPHWKSKIIPAIKKRSGNKCECCGLENGQKVYSIKAWVKSNGKYKFQSLWFRDGMDADREWNNITTSQPIKIVKVVLTVAHLDHDEENWDVELDRLKHMCQICHLRYDAKEKYRRSLLK